MAISSMTGFGRSEGSLGAAAWSWEIRAVNGRGLDIRLRLPPGHDQLESRIREAVARHLTRGSCTIALNVQRSGETTRIRLNEAALEDVRVAVARACEICKLPPPTLDAILSLRGVLEVVEAVEGEGEATRRGEAMLGDLDVALTRLAA